MRLLLLVRAYQVLLLAIIRTCKLSIWSLCAGHTPATVVLQVNGHYIAKLDPLGLDQRPTPVELDLALYGFSDKDMDRE